MRYPSNDLGRQERPTILYLHDRPSGGAGESLYQMISPHNSPWNSIVVFVQDGFLREKFTALKHTPVYWRKTHSWLDNHHKFRLVNYIRLFLRFYRMLLLIRFLVVLSRRHKVDAIHTNTLFLIEGALAARILKLAHVWQIRELLDLDYYGNYLFPKRWIAAVVSRLSHAVLANSQRTKRALTSIGICPQKLVVVYNIINRPTVHQNVAELFSAQEGVPIVGYVGWITPNKRVEDFLDVAEQFSQRDVQFVIVGGWGGNRSYNEQIAQKHRNCSNRKNVHFVGIVPNAPQYMNSLSVLICPCYTESFGRTVAEALIAETPAIGICDSAVDEIIDDSESGYLAKKADVKHMVTCLEQLLNNEAKRRRMGIVGAKRAQQRFSSHVILPQLHSLYLKLCTI